MLLKKIQVKKNLFLVLAGSMLCGTVLAKSQIEKQKKANQNSSKSAGSSTNVSSQNKKSDVNTELRPIANSWFETKLNDWTEPIQYDLLLKLPVHKTLVQRIVKTHKEKPTAQTEEFIRRLQEAAEAYDGEEISDSLLKENIKRVKKAGSVSAKK